MSPSDDPRLGPYTDTAKQLRAAVELAGDQEGLRLVLETTVGQRYAVQLAEGEIRLRLLGSKQNA